MSGPRRRAQIGVRPWWLTVPRARWDRKQTSARRRAAARVTTFALLAALVAIAVAGALRRRIDLAAAALIGLALAAGLGVVAAATPAVPVLAATLGDTLLVGHCLTGQRWVWLVVAWGLGWLAVVGSRAYGCGPGRRTRQRGACCDGSGSRLGVRGRLLAAAAIAGASAATQLQAPDEHVALEDRPIAAIAMLLDAAIPSGPGRLRLHGRLDVATQLFKAAVPFLRLLGTAPPRPVAWRPAP